jgi:hypothetical protein
MEVSVLCSTKMICKTYPDTKIVTTISAQIMKDHLTPQLTATAIHRLKSRVKWSRNRKLISNKIKRILIKRNYLSISQKLLTTQVIFSIRNTMVSNFGSIFSQMTHLVCMSQRWRSIEKSSLWPRLQTIQSWNKISWFKRKR